MSEITGQKIRRTLLEVISENRGGSLQQVTVLRQAVSRLDIRGPHLEEAVLTQWYDLFRSGHLSWGLNLSNPDPPFCHLTDQGRSTLSHLSRDPANVEGYLSHLRETTEINEIAFSYIEEAVRTYNANCFKAAAVMVGAAAESLVLELRELLVEYLDSKNQDVPRKVKDWRIKRILDGLKALLDSLKTLMPAGLGENVDAYWSAFTHQIRTTRNDAGHPVDVSPVTPDRVHASLLIYPEIAAVVDQIRTWISEQ